MRLRATRPGTGLRALLLLLAAWALLASAAAAQPSRSGSLADGTAWLAPVRADGPLSVDTNRDGRSLMTRAPAGAPILAPMDGEIVHVGELDPQWGAGLVIRHAPGLFSILAAPSLEPFDAGLAAGRKLRRGETLGQARATTRQVDWGLYSYLPDPDDERVRFVGHPKDLTAETFRDRPQDAVSWLTGLSGPLDVTSLLADGLVHLRVEPEFDLKDSLRFSVNGVAVEGSRPTTSAAAAPVLREPGGNTSFLVPAGPAVLRTTERGWLGSSAEPDRFVVAAGTAVSLAIGRKRFAGPAGVVSTTVSRGSDRAVAVLLDRAASAARSEQERRPSGGQEPRPADDGRQAELKRLVEERLRAEAEERQRLAAQAREAERTAQAATQELARVREQLAAAQQAAQAAQADRAGTPAAARTSRRKALVIGNDSYTHVSPLAAARADARAMAGTLRTLGFEVQEHQDLGERAMRQALRDFKVKVQAGDEVLFYFAGHGVQIGGINYLLPADIHGNTEEQVRDESVQLQRVLDDMRDKGAGFMLAVVDACRDNPFASLGRSIGGRGLAPTTAATGQMIIFSAGTGQKALDRLNSADTSPNGVFTRVFLREMLTPGLPVDRVLRNVRQEVARLARSVGTEQVPALYDQALGEFVFRP